jgi:hypothetical protein
MVQAIININERTNYILNLIKARHNLKDKSSAINRMAEEYENEHLEVRPEYWKKLERIDKKKPISFKSVAELRKRYEK